MTQPAARSLEDLEREVDKAVGDVIAAQQTIWVRFRTMGLALAEIHARGLYPGPLGLTWDQYLRRRFGFGRDRAGQIIRAAEAGEDFALQLAEVNSRARVEVERRDTLAQVSTAKLPEPTNERQIRQLLAAPPEIRVKVWEASVRAAAREHSRPTAETIRSVTIAIQGRTRPDPHKEEQERLERTIRSAWERLDAGRLLPLLTTLSRDSRLSARYENPQEEHDAKNEPV